MAQRDQTVLVVEDEPGLYLLISQALERHGFRVLHAADGVSALAMWRQEAPDLIILDLRLPRLGGFEVCRRIRERSVVPIIVLTALDKESDKVSALDLGADDYLTKPFSIEELRARVSAALRRSRWYEQPPSQPLLRFGWLTLDLAERRIWRDNEEIRLTHTEWALLEELVRNAGTTMSHRTLLERVWGESYAEESRYLRAYIGRLRRKLEDDPARPRYLLTESGLGYRFVSQQRGRAKPSTSPAAATSSLRSTYLTNLPAQTVSVVGREQEVAMACTLLRSPDIRLLTLIGPPGVGKTCLAFQIATALLDEFSNGVFFVALASINDPSLVLPTIGRTLGVKETGSHSLMERLKVRLQDKHMLLLLDNFEQVASAVGVISELLAAAPYLKVLVTSRSALHIYGEHEILVSPLSLPDCQRFSSVDVLEQSPAVTLFTMRARAVRPDFALTQDNVCAVAAICARLDGLPLAIELAAAQTKLLPPQAILARLESRLKALTGGARDLPTRHQTLRGAIDWSYARLSPEEQALFARLWVFVGGWSLEAAEVVCEDSSAGSWGLVLGAAGPTPASKTAGSLSIVEGLLSLLNKSMIGQLAGPHGQSWFVMLETIREYAKERLVERGEVETLRRRHASYYLNLAETAEQELPGSKQRLWLERLEREHDNLRAALQWLLERGEVEMAMRLACELWRFWSIHGHLSEGRRWLEQALSHGRDQVPLTMASAPVWAKTLLAAGILASMQRDDARALALIEESLGLFRQLGDKAGLALALNNLGHVVRNLGDDERAHRLYEESLELFRETRTDWGVAAALHNLGLAPLKWGDYAQARALFEESMELFHAIGNSRGQALALTNLGEVARRMGDYAQAKALIEESLAIWRELGEKEGSIYGVEGLAGVAALQGETLRVARLYGAAEAFREAIGMPLPLNDRPRYEEAIALARSRVDEVAWSAAWAEGQAMTLEQAITYGLDGR